MAYLDTLRALGADPEQLEITYQQALKAGETAAFADAVDANYTENPDNLLYAAWHYRLAQVVAKTAERVIAWGWAAPLAIVNGLLLWFLSGDRFNLTVGGSNFQPLVLLAAIPISACFVALFLAAAGERLWRRDLLLILGMAVLVVYVLLLHPRVFPRAFERQYLTLMSIHLPLAAWAGIGMYLLWRKGDAADRFAFLIKSLEVFIVGGLFAGAGGLFTGITLGLFNAIGIQPPDLVMRLFFAGGAGLIPVLAVALIYDPRAAPKRQSFAEGLSKLIATVVRLLLPLTVAIGVIYLLFIALNFVEPFRNRDVLIIYNGMLFAVIALLVGVAPTPGSKISAGLQTWLRRGIVVVAALALIVSLYALAAILYRTLQDKLTPNRLAFIGWNVINIGILVLLLWKQSRADEDAWAPALWQTFAIGMIPYAVWALVVIVALPWAFGGAPKSLQSLPVDIRAIAEEEPYPILLDCPVSPHIYLLDDGAKRWIKDILTFQEQGFQWGQVHEVSCSSLRSLPDGVPIPADAGPPPQP